MVVGVCACLWILVPHKECSLFEDLVLVLVMTALRGLRVNASICFRGQGKGFNWLGCCWVGGEHEQCVWGIVGCYYIRSGR